MNFEKLPFVSIAIEHVVSKQGLLNSKLTPTDLNTELIFFELNSFFFAKVAELLYIDIDNKCIPSLEYL